MMKFVTAKVTRKTIQYMVDREEFQKSVISLIVHDGLSLVTFQQSAMRTLLGPAANQLSVSLDRDQIRHMVVAEADRLKEEIKSELSQECVFIKADAATRLMRNYMGINVQYFRDGEIKIKTLPIKDTDGGHDTEAVKNVINAVIKDFDLHVLSIVVDNAATMSKAVRLINEDDEDADDENEMDEDEVGVNLDDEVQLEKFAGIQDADFRMIHHMRCAIHTLQLAIRDGLKAEHVMKLLDKVRRVVKRLRTPNLLAVLRRRGGLLPVVDVPTRWGSTYLMTKRLLHLREHVQDLAAASPDLLLNESEWKKLETLATILKMPHDVTVKLQSASITPGSFLKEWSALKAASRKQPPLASPIANSMEQREDKLFDNDFFSGSHLRRCALPHSPQRRADGARPSVPL
ncbi:uncharacterized protein LOC133156228 [Syngnathus typhle]|uniref:uncharacterized protein LOC133156227 n=1 Tax=Syngnathus typhle TaxID=161592 RepID=UPI002A6A29B7|nr:uncharacterized protein LOC133156227 [Syngnathus typhle]XP_061138037.1 uncharacterized protein LOC133156228 [Syngnathus typhle]